MRRISDKFVGEFFYILGGGVCSPPFVLLSKALIKRPISETLATFCIHYRYPQILLAAYKSLFYCVCLDFGNVWFELYSQRLLPHKCTMFANFVCKNFQRYVSFLRSLVIGNTAWNICNLRHHFFFRLLNYHGNPRNIFSFLQFFSFASSSLPFLLFVFSVLK